jgi:signal transduction histidine kinase
MQETRCRGWLRVAVLLPGLSHDAMAASPAGLDPRTIYDVLTVTVCLLLVFGFNRWQAARSTRQKKDELAAAVAEQTRELTAKKETAEEANRLKSQFLANVSRELRTPINGILGTLELALMTPVTPEQRDYLDLTKNSAQALLGLLDDILDFSKIEAEKMEIDHTEFSLQQCIRGVVSTIAKRAEEKRLELKTRVAASVPDRLIGDPDRLRQILVTLLDNAVRFSSEPPAREGVRPEAVPNALGAALRSLKTANGQVVLEVALDKDRGGDETAPADSLWLRFSIRDSGPGVPRDQRDAIFQTFRQTEGSEVQRSGGAGLGLALCNRLVRMMDGRIWLESKDDAGSQFCFTARFGMVKNAPSSNPAADSNPAKEWIKGLKVLVAEDNRINQVVTSRMLEKHGFQAVVANNGREALQMLQWDKVDVVLMDVQMPELDGLEATRRIREMEKKTGAHMPILAMTANAMQGDRDECLSAGMDGYLAKPVESKQLLRAIEELVAR